ncbi:hypothetical protein BK133_06460 [Paenibacillus sp. FSL H8-0548]|uniref:hypothetical protein n=1 Tax=Paenibacillus sp. FSL H8-0548 TaxID=1920422 RepID=UPI00096CB4D5|nr:hypothetical protein [Paenibacillus sp. FSL H8-0548]OMF37242.1 hypothetical protein BK133_06460 [Paenibacillus sp. FSL H8-0548]
MMKAGAITAGAIALTLALGGGSLWTSQYVNAATASVDKQLEQSTQTDKGTAKKNHSGKRGGLGSGFEHIQEQLTAVLSLTAAELEAEQEAGKTIAAIAEENGVDVQTVIDALVSDQKVKLDEKLAEELAAGTITQEQYDIRLAAVSEQVTKFVNGEFTVPTKGDDKNGHEGKGSRGERPDGAGVKDKSAADEITDEE